MLSVLRMGGMRPRGNNLHGPVTGVSRPAATIGPASNQMITRSLPHA
jgi:hypothetical protein